MKLTFFQTLDIFDDALHRALFFLGFIRINPNARMTNNELLYFEALKNIGKDVSEAIKGRDTVPDAFACMETVTLLIAEIKPSIQWTNPDSTAACEEDIKNGKSFTETDNPQLGDIVMSATQGGNVGHCGILFPNEVIASNDSRSGLFDFNYTVSSWKRYFVEQKGLKMRYYRLL